MSDLTPEKLAELRRLLDTPPQHITIARDDALALLDAAAERDWLAGLLDEPRRSGCAVEIAGVRIAPCDERGQTADMRALDTAADRLAHMREARDDARAEVERLTGQIEAAKRRFADMLDFVKTYIPNGFRKTAKATKTKMLGMAATRAESHKLPPSGA